MTCLAFAMAYVEGESLADRVKRAGPLGVRETVRVLQDVGIRARLCAWTRRRASRHQAGQRHDRASDWPRARDGLRDRARFGCACRGTAEGLTRVGEVVGTPEYMSPEQATGDRVDGRSDLYSLGLTAHFAVTGRPAITGDTTGKLLARQITEALPPILTKRADLPAPLAEAIDCCVMKDPAGRFQSAEALVEALDTAQLAAPEIPVPIRLFAQEAGTLSLILVFGVFLMLVIYVSLSSGDTGTTIFLLPLVLIFTVL